MPVPDRERARIHVETIPVEARSFQGESAGLITRVAANIIDVAVVILGLVAVYLGIAGVMFLRQGARFTFPIVTYRAAYLAGFVALVVYFTVLWAAAGRTYGDRVLGLRVQTSKGQDSGSFAPACEPCSARCSRCCSPGSPSTATAGPCKISSSVRP